MKIFVKPIFHVPAYEEIRFHMQFASWYETEFVKAVIGQAQQDAQAEKIDGVHVQREKV